MWRVVNVKNVSLGKVKTEKIILKGQKKAFLLSYYMVYWIPKWMICKIGFYASSVRWMGSCHWNEKCVLRYIIRTRCKQYKRISHIVLGNVFDIHSITIGDILFNLVKRIISISKIQRRLFFNGWQSENWAGSPSASGR